MTDSAWDRLWAEHPEDAVRIARLKESALVAREADRTGDEEHIEHCRRKAAATQNALAARLLTLHNDLRAARDNLAWAESAIWDWADRGDTSGLQQLAEERPPDQVDRLLALHARSTELEAALSNIATMPVVGDKCGIAHSRNDPTCPVCVARAALDAARGANTQNVGTAAPDADATREDA